MVTPHDPWPLRREANSQPRFAWRSFGKPQEIYVQAFPGPGGKWQISRAGGSEPQWGPDGRELFHRTPERQMMRVEVQTGETFEAGIPETMFTASLRPLTINNRYLVTPDAQRFLLLSSLVEDSTPPTNVVVNWTAELGQR